MTTEVKLVSLKKRLEDEPRRNVNTFYSVNIGGIIKLFKSDGAAHRWLKNMGYVLNEDYRTYTKVNKSEHEIDLDRKYNIYNPSLNS